MTHDTGDAGTDDVPSEVVELRTYTLVPGRRDELIELFDRELVETQEAVGMAVIGQFRDLDDPNRFVWLRGFADMTARRRGLEAFYDGPVWAEHGSAAASTMIDSDDVLLLRLHREGTAIRPSARRPPPGTSGDGPGLVAVTVVALEGDRSPGFGPIFDELVVPSLADAGATILGVYETLRVPNDFPRLPVRDADVVFVWITAYDSEVAHRRAEERLAADRRWQQAFDPSSSGTGVTAVTSVRLVPTARSRTVVG